jgi:Tfp pilus assembly PilM family ATPase
MPKALNSVVGVDLGRHAPDSPDAMAHHLKLLFRDLGTSGKGCVAAVSSPDALIRIIEQPTTPTKLLRDALRLNGLTLLNQDCHDFILDCDQIPAAAVAPTPEGAGVPAAAAPAGRTMSRYLVGGLPRAEVNEISSAFSKNKTPVGAMQLAPICNYNAFEYSHPDIFNRESFVLVDIGHRETRVLVGAKRELVLARTIDYGGHDFLNAITAGDGIDRESAIMLVEQNDPGMLEASRASLFNLARELRSSIGFFEGQREEAISRVYFSGGLVRALMPLQILSDELEIACNTWDPFQNCQVDMPKAKLTAFDGERTHLNIACGAALELLLAA